MRFRVWFEGTEQPPVLPPEKQKELQDIFDDAFHALAGPRKKESGLTMSLSDLEFGKISGREAARKTLENKQIFRRLEELGDPTVAGNIKVTQDWLNSKIPPNSDTTISGLMEKLFGKDNFYKFSGSDAAKPDMAKAQVQPQPPKQGSPTPDNSMDQSTPQPPMPPPPMDGSMMQQPQVNGTMMPPAPTVPMPPKPAGAFMGLY